MWFSALFGSPVRIFKQQDPVQFVHDAIAGTHIDLFKVRKVVVRVVLALLPSRHRHAGGNVLAQSPRILPHGTFDQVFTGHARKVRSVQFFVLDGVEQQQLCHVLRIVVQVLDVQRWKLQKGDIVGSEQCVRVVRKGFRESGELDVLTKNRKFGIVADEFGWKFFVF